MLDLTSLFSSDLSECSLLNSCDYICQWWKPPPPKWFDPKRNPAEMPPPPGDKKEKHASLAWKYENHLHFSSNGESMTHETISDLCWWFQVIVSLAWCWCYPPETNMEPENDGSRKESPLPEIHFSGSILVNFGSVDFFWIFFTGHIFFFSIGPSTFQPPLCPKAPQHGVLQEHDAICHGWTNDICNGRQRLALVFLNETWESSCWVFRNDSELFTVHPNSYETSTKNGRKVEPPKKMTQEEALTKNWHSTNCSDGFYILSLVFVWLLSFYIVFLVSPMIQLWYSGALLSDVVGAQTSSLRHLPVTLLRLAYMEHWWWPPFPSC